MSNRILVTGANGQLGKEMQRVAASDPKNHYMFTDIAELDITDKGAVEAMVVENKIDVVVNCAAYTQVDQAEDDEAQAYLINCTAVAHLAAACQAHNATLIHISTDYVFDGTENIPYTEMKRVKPIGVYGKTKLQGEHEVIMSGCKYIMIRTSWLYSKWGHNFVKTMQRLTKEREQISVIFDQIGTPTYAGDLADFISEIITKKQLHQIGTYHYSNEGVTSWYDFAVEINDFCGHNCHIMPIHSYEYPCKVKRPHYSVLDKAKCKEVFGVKIPHWRASLVRCLTSIDNDSI